jgi:hypothetical protein
MPDLADLLDVRIRRPGAIADAKDRAVNLW